jgi:DNA-binding MarR family transcriptional regulator
MALPSEIDNHDPDIYRDILQFLLQLQQTSGVPMVRKEGEVLFLIKDEPGQPVKYYMNKSGMSSRWFNEILRQLLASKLVVQETCPDDSRRKLLS